MDSGIGGRQVGREHRIQLVEVGAHAAGAAFHQRARQVPARCRIVSARHVAQGEMSHRHGRRAHVHHVGAQRGEHPGRAWLGLRRLRQQSQFRFRRVGEQDPGHQAQGIAHAAAVALQHPAPGHDVVAAQRFSGGIIARAIQHHLHRRGGAGDDCRRRPVRSRRRRANCTACRRRPWRRTRRRHSQVRRGLGGQFADSAACVDQRGKDRARQAELLDALPAPVPAREIEQAGGAGQCGIDGAHAAQAPGEPLAHAEHGVHALEICPVAGSSATAVAPRRAGAVARSRFPPAAPAPFFPRPRSIHRRRGRRGCRPRAGFRRPRRAPRC